MDGITITGLMLRNEGNDIIVELEIDGKWVEVIKEYLPSDAIVSHIVEPLGILKAVEEGE